MKRKPVTKPSPRTATIAELSDALSVSDGTIRAWVKDGLPHSRTNRALRFSIEEVGAWMQANRRTGKMGRPPAEQSLTLEKVRIRKENALARRYEQLADRDAGKLLDADEVRREWVQTALVIRTKFEQMPAAIAPRLYGKTIPEIQAALEDDIAENLRALAGGQAARAADGDDGGARPTGADQPQ